MAWRYVLARRGFGAGAMWSDFGGLERMCLAGGCFLYTCDGYRHLCEERRI
jgi:hypothetical protein